MDEVHNLNHVDITYHLCYYFSMPVVISMPVVCGTKFPGRAQPLSHDPKGWFTESPWHCLTPAYNQLHTTFRLCQRRTPLKLNGHIWRQR
jgi:hypothetical protein